MTLTAADQQRIIQKESAWIDGDQFGGLDLSSFPDLHSAPPEKSRDDGRFARDWRDTGLSASAAALRSFVQNPDQSALARIGEETGNVDFIRDVADRRAQAVAAEFRQRCPDYLETKDNRQALVATVAYNSTLSPSQQTGNQDDVVRRLVERGYWTPENLERCYRELARQGYMEVEAGTARNLSDSEALRVARLAQSGRADLAIGEYLKFALGGEEPDLALVHDPRYREVCDSAVLYVWESGTADYSPTDERREFIQRYAAGRTLTLHLLDSAWAACQANEQRHDRSELLAPYQHPEVTPPPSAKEIDALDDTAVDRLYHSSLRAYADQFRRGPGVLA